MIDDTFLKMGSAVIEAEARAVSDLLPRINHEFVHACRLMLDCKGRIIVIGMGKSGHIGNKIASTLASTGTPAFFVHAGEAAQGDFGMITESDVIIAVSNSGETDEIVMLLPLLKRLGVPLIALCAKRQSSLGKATDAFIDISVEQEACPLNLAPTSSTTVTLVLGDALAIALLEARGFTEKDFARSHPAGRLGRRLLLHIDDVMHTGNEIPSVKTGALLRDALVEMTRKGLGMTAITDNDNKLLGIYTDGDLRRSLDSGINVHDASIVDVMTKKFVTVNGGILAEEALLTMQEKKINGLMVVDSENRLIGALNMHDLLRAGVV
jgi:arabinose-5-phosphate isomerase